MAWVKAHASAIFTTLGLTGIAFALWTMRDDLVDLDRPPLLNVFSSLVLVTIGVVCGARSWSALFDRAERDQLHHAKYTAQLARYLPMGNLVSAAGQVGMSTSDQTAPGATAVRWVVAFGLSIAAACSVAVYQLFADDWRWLCIVVLGAPVILARPVLRLPWQLVARFTDRLPFDAVPDQLRLLRSFGWGLITVHTMGLALWALLEGLGGDVDPLVTIAAFGIAWTAGAVVLPLPAGVGIREAVLVALIPTAAEIVLTAAVLHRAVHLIADAITAGQSMLRQRINSR